MSKKTDDVSAIEAALSPLEDGIVDDEVGFTLTYKGKTFDLNDTPYEGIPCDEFRFWQDGGTVTAFICCRNTFVHPVACENENEAEALYKQLQPVLHAKSRG